MNEGE
jgi:hypothetical protein